MKGKHFKEESNDIFSTSPHFKAKQYYPLIVKIVFILQIAVMIGATVYIALLHLLPLKYIIVLALFEILVGAFQFWLLRIKKKPNFMKTLCLILSVVILFVSIFGSIMIGTVYGSISKIPDAEAEVEAVKTDVTKKPFMVYLSGLDTRGSNSIKEKGLSDVNMVIAVNPKTAKILLVSVPRDYYVPLYGDSAKMDKLTHAGNRGVECSMSTLESVFDVKFNYYVKVNFKSVYDIVNALGGVTVVSDYNFKSRYSYTKKTYTFVKGENYLNGDAALAFARERKSFAGGDRQRGKHQQKIISAIVDKAMSPSILNPSKMQNVLNSVTENTKTNMAYTDISKLVKLQLNKMPKWKVDSLSVNGTGASRTTYSTPNQKLSVMIPDQSTVDTAKVAIQAVLEGKEIPSEDTSSQVSSN